MNKIDKKQSIKKEMVGSRETALTEKMAPEPLADAPIADTLDQTDTGPKRLIGLRLSFVLVTLFVALASSSAVHIPWFYTAKSNVKELVSKINEEVIVSILGEVNDLFNRTEGVQNAIAETLRDDTVDSANNKAVINLFFPFVKIQPHFSWISFGKDTGDFLGVNRMSKDRYQKVNSFWSEEAGTANRSYEYFIAQDGKSIKLQDQDKSEQTVYDARERPWYKQAVAKEDANTNPIWTDVYVFSSTSRPGLNTALRVERGDQFLGVLSVAIELERLSAYLKEKFSDKPGTAFIMKPDTSLIAFVDSGEVTVKSGSDTKPTLRKLEDSYHPLLVAAREALEQSGINLSAIEEPTQIDVSQADGAVMYVTYAPVGARGWIIGTVIPEEAFLKAINENNFNLMLLMSAALIVVVLLAIIISRNLFVRPISALTQQTKLIENFSLQDVTPVQSSIKEIDDLSTAFVQMAKGLGAFQKYMPSEVVQTLLKNDQLAQVGGINRTMTILFSDLEGFTTISETLGPSLVPHLSEYLHDMSTEIHKERGIIDKFIGDAIMAFWGAPVVNDNQAVDACRAALRCEEILKAKQDLGNSGDAPVFKARFGINTGRVIVGNIGSDARMDYTVLGDPVNLASRLEGLNKNYGTTILLGATTHEFAKYDVIARQVDTLKVKGKDQKTPLYELLALRPKPGAMVPGYEWILAYEAGLDLMEDQKFEDAIQKFETTINQRGEDKPSEVMIQRCREAIGSACPS